MNRKGKVAALGIAFVILFAASVALGGFVLMLTAGAVSSEFGWLAPIGFAAATGIYFGLSLLAGFLRPTKGSK